MKKKESKLLQRSTHGQSAFLVCDPLRLHMLQLSTMHVRLVMKVQTSDSNKGRAYATCAELLCSLEIRKGAGKPCSSVEHTTSYVPLEQAPRATEAFIALAALVV